MSQPPSQFYLIPTLWGLRQACISGKQWEKGIAHIAHHKVFKIIIILLVLSYKKSGITFIWITKQIMKMLFCFLMSIILNKSTAIHGNYQRKQVNLWDLFPWKSIVCKSKKYTMSIISMVGWEIRGGGGRVLTYTAIGRHDYIDIGLGKAWIDLPYVLFSAQPILDLLPPVLVTQSFHKVLVSLMYALTFWSNLKLFKTK